jgi:hypothetical protein
MKRLKSTITSPAAVKKLDAYLEAKGIGLTDFASRVRIPGEGGHDSEIIPVSIPKLIRSRFRDESGHGFRF